MQASRYMYLYLIRSRFVPDVTNVQTPDRASDLRHRFFNISPNLETASELTLSDEAYKTIVEELADVNEGFNAIAGRRSSIDWNGWNIAAMASPTELSVDVSFTAQRPDGGHNAFCVNTALIDTEHRLAAGAATIVREVDLNGSCVVRTSRNAPLDMRRVVQAIHTISGITLDSIAKEAQECEDLDIPHRMLDGGVLTALMSTVVLMALADTDRSYISKK